MMEYKEDEFLQLSGIQHFAFCQRQWALIHIEQQWAENVRTIEGEFLHQRAHDEQLKEKRGDLITSRGVRVLSKSLGITGICDVVEFRKHRKGVSLFGLDGTYIPTPVEYKRGAPKIHDADILQLAAQSMCLEEMLACEISTAYLYYGETRRRQEVEISENYRDQVRKICQEMHRLYERRYAPKVRVSKSCKACSLEELCLPVLCKNRGVKDYIERSVTE